MNRLLRIKAWPAFAILFLIPFILQYILVNADLMPYALSHWLSSIVIAVTIILYCAWIYIACIRLVKRLPRGTVLAADRVKVLLLFPVLYMVWLLLYNVLYFFRMDIGWFITIRGWIKAFSQIGFFLAVFGILYGMFVMARLLKTAECQREVAFRDFAGDFFRIWFFPFGIWNIQPRLNKMAAHAPDDMDIFKQEPAG